MRNYHWCCLTDNAYLDKKRKQVGLTENIDSGEMSRSSAVKNSLAGSIIRPQRQDGPRKYRASLAFGVGTGPGVGWREMSRGDGPQNSSALGVCLQPVSGHLFPTKKIILDRNFTFMACLSSP